MGRHEQFIGCHSCRGVSYAYGRRRQGRFAAWVIHIAQPCDRSIDASSGWNCVERERRWFAVFPFGVPTFGLWLVALREDLRAALLGGVRKVVQWTDSHDGRLAMFPVEQVDPSFNVNTLEDLAQAEAML